MVNFVLFEPKLRFTRVSFEIRLEECISDDAHLMVRLFEYSTTEF